MTLQKSNRQNLLMILTLSLFLLTSVSLAVAQGQGKGRGCEDGRRGPEHRIEMMAKRLELNEDQVTAIKAIHEKTKDQQVKTRKELKLLRHELKGEMLKDNPSEKNLLGLNEKMGQLKTEMKALRLKTQLAVRKELTPEQRDKMMLMGEGRGDQKRGHKGGQRGHRGANSGCKGTCDASRDNCRQSQQ